MERTEKQVGIKLYNVHIKNITELKLQKQKKDEIGETFDHTF